ncbi:MAG: lipocalin-like domain-containing protein [Planctomycetota bacterium]|nr:lipocalin-like domain-containing protein [Planctomycetota bacterium]
MSTAPFAGSWKLISSEMRTSTGEVLYPLGEDCVGRIIFDADGNFAAQLMRPGRPEFASGDIVRGTDEEIRAAYQGYVAFWSKINVDEAKKELTYEVEGSLFPNWIGHSNLRHYEFEGDRLIFKIPPFVMAEKEITGVLVWERVS